MSETPGRTRLRDAHRELTRGQIRESARALFHKQGMELTTIEEIAERGGFQRSTVYRHYRDKNEILDDIIADYAPKVRACVESLPIDPASERVVQRWMEAVTAFHAGERLSLNLIEQAAHRGRNNIAVDYLGDVILTGLGSRCEAFRRAAHPNASLRLRARAMFLVQQLTYSCELYLNDAERIWCNAVRDEAAANFFAFMTANPDDGEE